MPLGVVQLSEENVGSHLMKTENEQGLLGMGAVKHALPTAMQPRVSDSSSCLGVVNTQLSLPFTKKKSFDLNLPLPAEEDDKDEGSL